MTTSDVTKARREQRRPFYQEQQRKKKGKAVLAGRAGVRVRAVDDVELRVTQIYEQIWTKGNGGSNDRLRDNGRLCLRG